MTEKLTRRGLRVPNEFEVGAMTVVRVSEVMRKDVVPIAQEMTVSELAERMGRGEPACNLTQGLPIVSPDGKLVGVVTQGDLLRALEQDPRGTMTVLKAGSQDPIVAYPDELVHDAMHRMLQHDIGRLPVVSRENPQQMVGYFNRASLLGAWTHQIEDEKLREHGWIRKWRNSDKRARQTSRAAQK
jgi:CBS domain-containing protein